MTPKACAVPQDQIAQTAQRSNTVINSPELLEHILLQLDLRTLVTSAQLVSRFWRELIQRSPSLQRSLFLLPADGSKNENGERTLNPLLEAAFPTWFRGTMSSDIATDMPWAKTRLQTFLRPEASWRRMLVCQPPAYALGIVDIKGVQRWSSRAVRVRNPNDGVRMWDFLDICVNWPLPEFQVCWDSHTQPVDDRWCKSASSIWPHVERAQNEVDILVYRSSYRGCMDPAVDDAYGYIAGFVEKFKPSTPCNEDEWINEEAGGWWF